MHGFLAFLNTFRRRSIPTIVRTRVILYASAVKLNSARTFTKQRIFGSQITENYIFGGDLLATRNSTVTDLICRVGFMCKRGFMTLSRQG
jgi:hypothetical protein